MSMSSLARPSFWGSAGISSGTGMARPLIQAPRRVPAQRVSEHRWISREPSSSKVLRRQEGAGTVRIGVSCQEESS
jgi:hypothetical protein